MNKQEFEKMWKSDPSVKRLTKDEETLHPDGTANSAARSYY